MTKLPKRQQGDFNVGVMMVLSNFSQGAFFNSQGGLFGWGNSSTGVLCNGFINSSSFPLQEAIYDPNTTLPPAGAQIVDWAFTNGNVYVVFNNGWVYSGGDNSYGQLGHGDTTARPYLKRIEYFVTNFLSVTNVWAGGSISNTNGSGCVYFGISGGIYACGANAAGNLGNASNPTSNLTTPSPCAGVSQTITDVEMSAVSGNFSTYLLGADGTVLVAGYNNQGQLGVGTTTNVTGGFIHAQASTGGNLASIVSISTTGGGGSGGSVLVLDSNQKVWTAGYNGSGQLGQGNTNNLTKFTTVTSLSNISAAGIGGGNYGYAYAISQSGVLYTWGYNGQNNLFQNNSTNPVTSPTTTVLSAGLVNNIIFPKDEALSSNAQLFAVISGGTQIIYAGVNNGQNGIPGTSNPGAFKYIPYPAPSPLGQAMLIDSVFVHGSGTTQRLFVQTNLGNVFAFGANVDSVCTAGLDSNNMPAAIYGYDILNVEPPLQLP